MAKSSGPGGRFLVTLLCLSLADLAAPSPLPPPLPSSSPDLKDCLDASKSLAAAAKEALHQLQELGILNFQCTLEAVDLVDITKNKTNTTKACMPEESKTGNCPALQRADFDKSKCLHGIKEDLIAYRAEFKNFSIAYKAEFKNFSNQKMLAAIDNMIQAMKIKNVSKEQPSTNRGGSASFNDRMRLCGVFHAFRIRTVTISRMMNYLNTPGSSS